MEDDAGAAEYLCYSVVKTAGEEFGDELPRTEFFKRCFLVYMELLEEDLDVELPVYWYEHGVTIDLDELTTLFLAFEPRRFSSGRRGRVAQIKEEWADFDLSEELRTKITDKAREVCSRYAGVFDTSQVKDDTYAEYGNQFVQWLNEMRYFVENLDDIDRVSQDAYVPGVDISFEDVTGVETGMSGDDDVDDIEIEVLNYLDHLVVTYPENTYRRMEPQFLDWESITRQMALNHMFSQLSNFTSEFWIAFSRGELRIHHNWNIPSGKKRRWIRKRPEVVEGLEQKIDHYRNVLLKHRDETDSLNAVSHEFDNTVEDLYREIGGS